MEVKYARAHSIYDILFAGGPIRKVYNILSTGCPH